MDALPVSRQEDLTLKVMIDVIRPIGSGTVIPAEKTALMPSIGQHQGFKTISQLFKYSLPEGVGSPAKHGDVAA